MHATNVKPTILGGVSRGFRSRFLDSGAQSPIFWYPKVGTFVESALFQVTTSSKPSKMRFENCKTSTRKTENLAHLTYPHAESGMR